MEIKGQRVFLRDFVEEDIGDRIRWETIETEWLEWDAPWEEEPFDPDEYRSRMKKRLSIEQDPDRFRHGFQICINDETQKHIGWINAYHIDNDYCYTSDDGKFTIGIVIADLGSRRKGYATEAWNLYIKYALDSGIEDIYTQTWSGNTRVIGLMKKLGFEECHREEGIRMVRGELYDGLTFKLNVLKYKEFNREGEPK